MAGGISRLVRTIVEDCVGLLCLGILREGRAKGIPSAHGMFAGGQPVGEDDLHLNIVQNGLVEELRVILVILKLGVQIVSGQLDWWIK